MGDTSFLLCTDPASPPGFTAESGTWRIDPACLLAVRETLRLASKWLRREWKPDFTREQPFGTGRGLRLRYAGPSIAITGLPTPAAEATYELEFHYVELPYLRSSIECYIAKPRRHSVTRTQGDPHG